MRVLSLSLLVCHIFCFKSGKVGASEKKKLHPFLLSLQYPPKKNPPTFGTKTREKRGGRRKRPSHFYFLAPGKKRQLPLLRHGEEKEKREEAACLFHLIWASQGEGGGRRCFPMVEKEEAEPEASPLSGPSSSFPPLLTLGEQICDLT